MVPEPGSAPERAVLAATRAAVRELQRVEAVRAVFAELQGRVRLPSTTRNARRPTRSAPMADADLVDPKEVMR